MIEMPAAETDRTRVTPGVPAIAISMGKVTIRSTSSGERPPASVITTTLVLLRSGKTSTGMRCSDRPP